MVVSGQGISFIKKHESLRLHPYYDGGGKLTIGYGHTKNVYITDSITKETAEEFLKEDLFFVETAINMRGLKLNQNQYDAIASFIFNLGIGNFRTSTLLKKINKNPNDLTIAGEFVRWIKINGKIDYRAGSLGLLRRRIEESKLYFT